MEQLISKLQGKSVSLVGGAQSILSSNNGELIDSSDIVIRMNRSFPKKSASQGRKTDLLTLSCSISRLQYWWNYKKPPVMWMSPKKDSLPSWMTKNVQVEFYPETAWNALSLKLEGNRPSTGAMTFDFVTQHLRPKQLNIFGFDFKRSKTLFEKKNKLGPHNWELEKQLALKTIQEALDEGLEWVIHY